MHHKKPRIGLTTYPYGEGYGFHTPREYVEAVFRAGGVPVLLPTVDADMAETWVDGIEGLILIGGGDIDPELHGNAMHETVYSLNPVRDNCEMALARIALSRDMPILAICRGLQVVNVVCGGSLHVHLPEVVGEQVLHRSPSRTPTPHAVEVASDSLLAHTMGVTKVTTASWHHQAVDQLGSNLHAVAWAEDGAIEAIASSYARYLLAVQWHPELTAATDPTQQAVFDGLVQASQKVEV